MGKSEFFLRHLSSFTAPVVMCLLLPWLILRWEKHPFPQTLQQASWLQTTTGLLITAVGLALFIHTVHMFIRIGNGTIMPWDPTRKLITGSLYAYVRNPMILSLVILLAGEAVLFHSRGVALLAALNLIVNTLYFHFSEEPGLEKRFGQEYKEYKQNVRMWIPRLKPWKPSR